MRTTVILLLLLGLATPLSAHAQTTAPDTRLDRQSWRAEQNRLSPSEQRAGERRMDAIDRKAQTDPRAARDMQRIWDADRSLNTINRPPNSMPTKPGSPSLVGPGDHN